MKQWKTYWIWYSEEHSERKRCMRNVVNHALKMKTAQSPAKSGTECMEIGNMDLYAYGQIENLDELAKKNGIDIPRLRGYRLMAEMTPFSDEEIEKNIREVYKDTLELYTPSKHCAVMKGRKLYDKRQAKGEARAHAKRTRKQMEMYNRYCGCKDVLMVHARIGKWNWAEYGGPLISMEKWFIEKADDGYDPTYCDIYVRIKRDDEE